MHVPVQSIIDKFIGRFKTLMGPFVIPMFSIDDNPPDYDDGWTVPGMIDKITRGIVVHLINVEELATAIATAMGGGGGGSGATEAKQDDQITQLATLISNTTGLSTEVTLALIKTAAESSDATLTSIASTVATETTAQQIRDALAPLATETTLATLATDATAQDILTALGPLATNATLLDVKSAVQALRADATLDSIVTALMPLGDAATEVTAAAILSELQDSGLDIATIKDTLVTIESEVDDLEPYALDTKTAVESIDDKTPAILGTALAVQRGTMNGTSQALPTANYPRGFKVANLSASTIIYLYEGVATTANGYPLFPQCELAFDLSNPDVLQGITDGTSATFAIGAVT